MPPVDGSSRAAKTFPVILVILFYQCMKNGILFATGDANRVQPALESQFATGNHSRFSNPNRKRVPTYPKGYMQWVSVRQPQKLAQLQQTHMTIL